MGKNPMISYYSLLNAFKVAGINDFDLDDVECVAVSLIYKVCFILFILFSY